jgi:hypothetical protein
VREGSLLSAALLRDAIRIGSHSNELVERNPTSSGTLAAQ